ncbi:MULTISPECIES: hypothetical protein [unclassified Aminobacter]|nr:MULTISPECIES: hypothetical protein [unclassified Aminobacter]
MKLRWITLIGREFLINYQCGAIIQSAIMQKAPDTAGVQYLELRTSGESS